MNPIKTIATIHIQRWYFLKIKCCHQNQRALVFDIIAHTQRRWAVWYFFIFLSLHMHYFLIALTQIQIFRSWSLKTKGDASELASHLNNRRSKQTILQGHGLKIRPGYLICNWSFRQHRSQRSRPSSRVLLCTVPPPPPPPSAPLSPSLIQMQRAVSNRMRADLIQKASLKISASRI